MGPPDPDGTAEPVRLSDVQATIEQATLATAQLNQLAESVDRLLNTSGGASRLGEFEGAIAIAEAGGARLINRVFLYAAGLVVVIFVASVLRGRLARGKPAQNSR